MSTHFQQTLEKLIDRILVKCRGNERTNFLRGQLNENLTLLIHICNGIVLTNNNLIEFLRKLIRLSGRS